MAFASTSNKLSHTKVRKGCMNAVFAKPFKVLKHLIFETIMSIFAQYLMFNFPTSDINRKLNNIFTIMCVLCVRHLKYL